MEYTQIKLMEILNNHQKWLAGTGGVRANLIGADLRRVNLSGADLRHVDLSGANLNGVNLSDANLKYIDLNGTNLSDANLSGTDLRCANLRHTNLRYANLSGANLSDANLRHANLRHANLNDVNLIDTDLKCADLNGANLRHVNLSGANLKYADLSGADLRYADLSDAKGLLDPIKYIEENFEKTEKGIIVYKSFGEHYAPNPNWEITEGSIIEEIVNPLPTVKCGSGINVATKEWAERKCINQIWKCLIRWEWLAGVVVPYQTEGQIRASRVQLIKPVNYL